MSLRNHVDPELLETLDAFGAMGLHTNPVSEDTLATYREELAALHRQAPPPDTTGLTLSKLNIPSADGQSVNRVLVYRPTIAHAPTALVMYIHGGGFVLGAPEYHEERCCRIARTLGVTVVAPAYRLAPENPFPSGLDDCYACLQEIESLADELGIDAERIAVSGESDGGGLAASLVQRSVAENGPQIAYQALHYPMLDHRTGGDEAKTDERCGEFVWTRESNRYAWSAYLGDNDPEQIPYAVPALSRDLGALPPCFLSTASLDLFLDENIAYARRLLASGVQTELVVYPGAFHAFDQSAGAAISRKFEADLLSALKRGLGI